VGGIPARNSTIVIPIARDLGARVFKRKLMDLNQEDTAREKREVSARLELLE
jgi:hypothetical protein